MRVGIDYRILTVGPSAATRGMPRYTQQQLREVLARGTEDEFVLLCDPRTDRSLILPEILGSPNVSVALVPEAATTDVHDDRTMLLKAEILESWLAGQQLDLYHATTPFYLDQLLVAGHDAFPYVATVYDLIPLIYPSQYLATPKLRQLYLLAAAMVSRATRLVAISEAARRDASHYLGFPEDRIDVASPIAEPFFRPMPDAEVTAALAALRVRAGVPDEFVLSVADLHFTKNLETLLRGYALLPAAVRSELPLVVACHLSAAHQDYLASLAAGLGVAGHVRTTGLVSDRELAALYNAARFVVHPSRFEGFGLPVLEAMQSGTPVIASRSSSLPEVAGDAAILVDPDDAPAFAEAMELLFDDPDRCRDMRVRGLARAAVYTGGALARATQSAYSAAVAPGDPDRPAQPRIAMWAPLPPLPTGVAGYTAKLVQELAAGWDITLFVDDGYLPSMDVLLAHRVHHAGAFDRLAPSFAAVIYQLGASVFHLYMEAAIRRHPGVLVLHDLIWSHAVHHRYAEDRDLEGFRRRLRELEGDGAVAEYDAIDRSDHRRWAERLHQVLERHLMLGDLVSASRAQIVHFPAGVDELASRYTDARPTFVPMGVPEADGGRPELHVASARARLGIPQGTFVIGVYGIVDEVKRVHAVVRALPEVLRVSPEALLLIVGPVLDPSYRDGLCALAGDVGVEHAVRITGPVGDAAFADHLAAADVVVNLRFPSRKQMSATVLRAAAAGKPVILSDLPEWDFLPSTFCLRVPAGGAGEVDAVAACLVTLAHDGQLRARLAAGARRYHRSHATVVGMAAAYAGVLERILPRDAAGARERAATTPPGRRTTPNVNLNKVCEIEDFVDPELAASLEDVFSYRLAGSNDRGDWEAAMGVRALGAGGALRPDAVVLVVGAGAGVTSFWLTRHVGRVVAVDRYLASEAVDGSSETMLTDPAGVAPYQFDPGRLVVQHMDARRLRFDDESFDGVVSAGGMGRLGTFEDIAATAYEMGRVLKRGGVLSIATEILLSGPPGGSGRPGAVLLSPADLLRYVVEASGLELVDELRLEVSEATLATQRHLAHAIPDRPLSVGAVEHRPELVVVDGGYVYASVHLALRKGDRYPATSNGWAEPSSASVTAIEEENRQLVFGDPPAPPAASGDRPLPLPESWAAKGVLARRQAADALGRWECVAETTARFVALHTRLDATVARIKAEAALAGGCAASVDATVAAQPDLLRRIEELAHEAGTTAGRGPTPAPAGQAAGWRWCPIELPDGTAFGVMVDPAMGDEVTAALLAGGGSIDWTSVMLMLDKVRAGDVVVDLGAFLGTFTLAAAAAGCVVVAIEASPLNATLLRASAARNGFADVHVVNAVVGDAPGLIGFQSDGPFGYVEWTVDRDDHVPSFVVRVVTVDALLDELRRPDGPLTGDRRRVALVKVDVEGSEIRAIRGMAGLLGGPDAPLVLIESNGYTLDFYGLGPADLLKELEGLGYDSYLVDRDRLWRVPPSEVQLQTVVDYLAVKGPLHSSDAWRVEGPLPIEERISRMVQECGRSSPYTEGQRTYVGRALAGAGPEVLHRSEVGALLAGLRADPAESVRMAAAWSAPAPRDAE